MSLAESKNGNPNGEQAILGGMGIHHRQILTSQSTQDQLGQKCERNRVTSHSSVSTCIVWIKSCLVRALINWNELFWKSQAYLCPKTWIAFAWIIKLAFWAVLELEFPSLSLDHCFLIIRKHLERQCFHSPFFFFSLSSKFTFMCQAQQGIPRWFPRRVHC